MHWNLLTDIIPKDASEVLLAILANRGIQEPDAFLHPTSPLEITPAAVGIDASQIHDAVSRLQIARDKQEKIVIYGDYDADGICATTILWETLHGIGCDVTPFIPDRERHGYGLSSRGVDEILTAGTPNIILTVDNGITAHTQWERLRDLGVTTILTDHHEPDAKKPSVDYLIHTTKLCGATVAWFLAREILKTIGHRPQATGIESLLDLCAVATIADQVPLLGANRSFAKFGLEQLNKTDRLGLQVLCESAGLVLGEIDTYAVNFAIAPRINAMGRISSAMDALRALCTKNEKKARERIAVLSETNMRRQELTTEMIELALAQEQTWEEEHIIVIGHESFHEGVIGLIAGKLMEKYHKPAVVFALGKETAKGSARSIPGVHITNMLRDIRDDLIEVGGHPLAAGVKIVSSRLEVVQRRLTTLARERISTTLLTPSLSVDCELPASLLNMETAESIQALAPYGSGNREPVFLFRDWQITDAKRIGKEGKHIKCSIFNSQFSISCTALGWGMGKRFNELNSLTTIDLVGKLAINEWRGKKTIQITIQDFHV